MRDIANAETLRAIIAAADTATELPPDDVSDKMFRLAHQFNNVLAIVLGYSDILLAQVEPASPQHRTVEKIQQAVHRGSGLTSRLMEISKHAATYSE